MKKQNLILTAIFMLFFAQNAGAWGYKSDSGNWNNCQGSNNGSFPTQNPFYSPSGAVESSTEVGIFTNPRNGFNITQNDGCSGQQLYVGLSGTAANSVSTIVRAAVKWTDGINCQNTVVIPEGKIYLNAGGVQYEMANVGNYQFEKIVPYAAVISIFGADLTATIEAQNSMPAGGKPASVKLNIPNRNVTLTQTSSKLIWAMKVKFNLRNNQVTFEEAVTVEDNQNRCFPFNSGINITVKIYNNAIANPFMYIEDSRTDKPNQTWQYCSANRNHYLNSSNTSGNPKTYAFRIECHESDYAEFFGLTPFERICIEGIDIFIGYDGATDKENAIFYPVSIRHDLDADRSGNNTLNNALGEFIDIVPLDSNEMVNVGQPFKIRFATANTDIIGLYFRGFKGYTDQNMWENYSNRLLTKIDEAQIEGKTLFNGAIIEPKTVRWYEYTVTNMVALSLPYGGSEADLQAYADGTTDRITGIMQIGNEAFTAVQRTYKLIYEPDNTLDNIAISPADNTVLLASTQQFSAMPYNSTGVAVIGVSYVWEILETTSCTIDSAGLFTANETGVFTIKCTATQGGIVIYDTTTINVINNINMYKIINTEERNDQKYVVPSAIKERAGTYVKVYLNITQGTFDLSKITFIDVIGNTEDMENTEQEPPIQGAPAAVKREFFEIPTNSIFLLDGLILNTEYIFAIMIEDEQGNVSDTVYVEFKTTNGSIVTNLNETTDIQPIISPNPATNILHISGLTEAKEVKIFDSLGKIVLAEQTNGNINISVLSKGIYFININNKFIKFIKQ